MFPTPFPLLSASKRYEVSGANDSPPKNINEPSWNERKVVNKKMFKKISLGLLVLLLGTSLLFQWRICTFLIDGIISKGDMQLFSSSLSLRSSPSSGANVSRVACKKPEPQVTLIYNFNNINSNNRYDQDLERAKASMKDFLSRTKKSASLTTLKDVDVPTSAKEIAERDWRASKKATLAKLRLVLVPLSRHYKLYKPASMGHQYWRPRYQPTPNTMRSSTPAYKPKTSSQYAPYHTPSYFTPGRMATTYQPQAPYQTWQPSHQSIPWN